MKYTRGRSFCVIQHKRTVPLSRNGVYNMKKILVLIPAEEPHKKKLEAAAPGCEFIYSSTQDATPEMVQEANVIIGLPKAADIQASGNLELLQLSSAGADSYIKPGVLGEKTILTNATGAYGKAVAEHAFALTMMLIKKLYLYRDEQKKRSWTDHGTVTSLSNATVVVVGLGDIGTTYARLVKAMGATVIGVKRRASIPPSCVDEIILTEDLDQVLPRADIVMSVLPGTAETTHLFTLERFKMMKDSAYFVNVGRGSVVASDVLYQALSEHLITAAGVDVTDPEPLPADSPLWALDNLVITPHVSGWYHLRETLEGIVDIAAGNLARLMAGEEPENIVDFATGYKK